LAKCFREEDFLEINQSEIRNNSFKYYLCNNWETFLLANFIFLILRKSKCRP